MVPVFSLLIVATLSMVVMRIAAMALMLTGLSRESARFQARSAFTGTGFTTVEAESVLSHPVRRRIIMLLMLVGNVGLATVMATIVLSVLGAGQRGNLLFSVLWLTAGLIALTALSMSRRLEVWMNRLIARNLKRWARLDVTDYVAVLQLHKGYAVSEMKVEKGDWLDEKTLAEAALPREGVLVLGISRPGGVYIGAPGGGDRITAGDTLILYSALTRVRELDSRQAGEKGESAHDRAMVEHIGEMEKDRETDSPDKKQSYTPRK
ncbi:MAG: potassium transporter TrkA [Synergistaceae bacterium]|nr:potassium transporter TrkA [Synergistaceae bacterium]